MTEEMTQENVQDSQENKATEAQESNANSNLLQEVMTKKATIKELKEKVASFEAKEKQSAEAKMVEEGKLKELLSEKDATIKENKSIMESQSKIVDSYKQLLINSLTTDDERKEHLNTKSVDFLVELAEEKAKIQPPQVTNPKESLGAVRNSVVSKSYGEMNEAERREWHKAQFKS